MSFTGFSEEDLHRMKYTGTGTKSGPYVSNTNARKVDTIGAKSKRARQQYKSPILQNQNSDDIIDSIEFDKCKLSLKSPSTPPTAIEDIVNNNKSTENTNGTSCDTVKTETQVTDTKEVLDMTLHDSNLDETDNHSALDAATMSNNTTAPDVLRYLHNYAEDDLVSHKVKLEELQLQQKLMEEQNKKRKEMLAKALADRTKQTEEEVQKLEKIKKELQVLDGQFSLDVAVLRKKIDQACLSYSEAEKHYLRVEKDFLQAKINLQKEKEKKELLTEHLCALITHNETRKAQKLETLMLELATDKKNSVNDDATTPTQDKAIVIDGVDGTGKMVELPSDS